MRPVYPQSGYTEADVHNLLGSRQFAMADCYTITPRYGSALRLTTAGIDVTVTPIPSGSAVTYSSPSDVRVDGLRLRMSLGTEVDEQDMRIHYNNSALLAGLPFSMALRLGRLDGATISRDRFFAYSMNPPSWVGGTPLFRGRLSSVDSISRSYADVKVKSDLVLLNTLAPRDLYQPGCVHSLYDPGCGLNKNDWDVTGTVQSGSTSQVINWSSSAENLTLGMIYIDDPQGTTLVRTIRKATTSQLFLAYPLDFVPSVGLTFSAFQGCNRTYARCGDFSNQSRFKGFPFVPVAETAV